MTDEWLYPIILEEEENMFEAYTSKNDAEDDEDDLELD